MIHCREVVDRFSSVPMDGRATPTMETSSPSRNRTVHNTARTPHSLGVQRCSRGAVGDTATVVGSTAREASVIVTPANLDAHASNVHAKYLGASYACAFSAAAA